MSELVAFDDAARELETTTEGIAKLVSAGKLKTAEEGGLLKVTRQSLEAYKSESAPAPLEVSGEPEPEGPLPTISLAPEEEAEKVVEAPAPEATGPETESIFGDEGFELETFEEVGAPAGAEAELAELEEAGEELEAGEVVEAMPSARLQRMAVAPPVSKAATVMAVLTCLVLLFAGLVTLSFVRGSPLGIVQSVNEPLLRAVDVEPFSPGAPAVRPAQPTPAAEPAPAVAPETPAPPAESAAPETISEAVPEQPQEVMAGPAEEVGQGVQEPAESIEATPSEEAEPTESAPSQE